MKARTLACLVLLGCGGASQTTIPVEGSEENVGLMAGKWEGSYQGLESGRQGTVSFDLTLGHHAAEGQVFMYPQGASGPGQPLQVRFVEVKKGQINGKIAPYTDPSCNCQVETEFVGAIKGDVIDGTFTTHVVGTDKTQGGKWEAVRKAHD